MGFDECGPQAFRESHSFARVCSIIKVVNSTVKVDARLKYGVFWRSNFGWNFHLSSALVSAACINKVYFFNLYL